MAVSTRKDLKQLEALKVEAKQKTTTLRNNRAIAVVKEFYETLPLYGLTLQHDEDDFFFEIEGIQYIVDPFDKEYQPVRRGRPGNWYKFTDCPSLLRNIKLYFWEYKGIEVLPSIDLLSLLKTPHARYVQQQALK